MQASERPTWRDGTCRHTGGMLRVALVLPLLLLAACGGPRDTGYPDWRLLPVVEPPQLAESETVILLQDQPLSARVLGRLAALDRVLVVIPGVDSGVLAESVAWADRLGAEAGCGLTIFYHWLPESRGRRVLNPGSTQLAGEHLADVLEALDLDAEGPAIDVLAHSGGGVVLRKTVRALDQRDADTRLRHVLFMGTPISPAAVLAPTLARSDALCNVVSSYDKVVRRLSDHVNGLPGLGDEPPDWNLRMDRSLTGLVMRHMSYLDDGPEMRLTWAALLREGRLPSACPMPDRRLVTLAQLDAHARWLRGHWVGDVVDAADVGRDELGSDDPDRVCYGVMIAGLARDVTAWPQIDRLLRDPTTPAYVRREIVRYLANLRDGRYLPILRWIEAHDPANRQVATDALRELKRARVRPPRVGDRRR